MNHPLNNSKLNPSLIVPRKSTLFQPDIYPDTLSTKPAMTVNEWFVLGSNAKPLLMSMQKDLPSSNDVITMRRTIANGTSTLGRIKKDEEKEDEKSNKYRRQTSEIVIERNSAVSADNNINKKYAFLSANTAPDYRPYSIGERIQNKQDKTNTNQSTKIQQLQSIFGGQAVVTTTVTTTTKENGLSVIENSLDNANLVHAENEVRFMEYIISKEY